MKIISSIRFSICASTLLLISCNILTYPKPNYIKIGTQTWSVSNLQVNHFRNGDAILEAESDEAWVKAGSDSKPAWCYFNNDSTLENTYGKIYNWFAVNDTRGLADSGWHIPSDAEWNGLIDILGGPDSAGSKMRSKQGWNNEANGNNSSGFTGLPAGYRYNNGAFKGMGEYASWWSSSAMESSGAWYRYLSTKEDRLNRTFSDQRDGFSVRCIKN